jgi:alkylhydroperoxidase/carboxymuconolactone decarboxylase family protein YurZ
MNAKQLIAVAALAVIGTSAFAAEAEQFVPQTGALTRAEVRAELSRAQAAGEIATVAEAYGGFTPVAKAVKMDESKVARSRDEVRTEARAAVRAPAFNTLYVGG